MIFDRTWLTKQVVLPCEERRTESVKDVQTLIGVPGSTPCDGTWQPHTFYQSENRGGVAYLLYTCDACGHKRIFGNIAAVN